MKVAILAGGFGTRFAEETHDKPKPMITIGGRPILWHIMNLYSHFGFREFAIAAGYRGECIKQYWLNYSTLHGDLRIDMENGAVSARNGDTPPWLIEVIDTGLKTQTGGRIRRLAPNLGNETFMLTWGDGLADINLRGLLEFHRHHGKLATVTAVRPPARFGHLEFDGDRVVEFSEKPQVGEGWINGAFFVLEPGALDYIDGDATHWEREPMEQLARDGELMAYRHEGFWQCMDTLRDRRRLEQLWADGNPPWKVWDRPE